MADRYQRIEIIQQTLTLCRENPVLAEAVRHSVEHQKIYWEENLVEGQGVCRQQQAQVVVSGKRSVEAAAQYAGKRVCVLNFASTVTPGGGVLHGTTAQEESICRITTLYPALADRSASEKFYQRHRQAISNGTMSRRNNDDCIFTPGVMAFRRDDFNCELLPEEQWFSLDVITCAAPDQRSLPGEVPYRPSEAALQAVFERRIERILSIAASNQVEVLVLGAFGCGVFGNSPYVVAKAFLSCLDKFGHFFDTIEFAVYASSPAAANYQAFVRTFS